MLDLPRENNIPSGKSRKEISLQPQKAIKTYQGAFFLMKPCSRNALLYAERAFGEGIEIENGISYILSGCNNCATWPRTLGIPFVEETDQMSDYMEKLKIAGRPWH